MKSSTIFRRILFTSQVVSPIIGSSAFALGMRHHRNHHSKVLHSSATPAAPLAMSEEDFEFDFIAAATEAAVEREDRESSEAASRVEPIVAKTTTATRTPVAPQPSTSLTTTDDDYEFDFIAAATQAAIERENREPQYRVDTDESSFKVFPAVDPLANVMWAGQENKALLRSE